VEGFGEQPTKIYSPWTLRPTDRPTKPTTHSHQQRNPNRFLTHWQVVLVCCRILASPVFLQGKGKGKGKTREREREKSEFVTPSPLVAASPIKRDSGCRNSVVSTTNNSFRATITCALASSSTRIILLRSELNYRKVVSFPWWPPPHPTGSKLVFIDSVASDVSLGTHISSDGISTPQLPTPRNSGTSYPEIDSTSTYRHRSASHYPKAQTFSFPHTYATITMGTSPDTTKNGELSAKAPITDHTKPGIYFSLTL